MSDTSQCINNIQLGLELLDMHYTENSHVIRTMFLTTRNRNSNQLLMSPTFPLEILEIVISHVPDDPLTLTSLAVTSPLLTDYAQARLFSHFRTDRWGIRSSAEPHCHTTKFLRAIVANHRLALYVRKFAAPFLGSRYSQPADEDWFPMWLEALPLMENLTSLTLFTYTKYTPTLLLETVVTCPFRLTELRWNWIDLNPCSRRQELMSTFLTAQTELQSLSLKMSPIPLFPQHALQKLKTLATTCNNIVTILPDRHIDTLDCLYLDPDDSDFEFMTPMLPLVAPLRSIKRLCLGISTMWHRNMETYLPSLEVLQTSVAMVRDYHFIASNFPKLHTIHITRATSMTEQGVMSKWLFSNLPTLETVLWSPPFTSQVPSPQPRYDCWHRESAPGFLEAAEVHERTGLLLIDKLYPPPNELG